MSKSRKIKKSVVIALSAVIVFGGVAVFSNNSDAEAQVGGGVSVNLSETGLLRILDRLLPKEETDKPLDEPTLGAIPGSNFPEETSQGGLRTLGALRTWSSSSAVCSFGPLTASSSLQYLHVWGASANNTAGQITIYHATTTPLLGDNVATSSGVRLTSVAVAAGTRIDYVSTSTSLLVGGKAPLFSSGDVLIVDYNGTSTLGSHHAGDSTCGAEFKYLN